MKGEDIKTTPTSPPASAFWIFLASGIAAAVVFALVAIIFASRIDNIRCVTAQGALVLPDPVPDGGLSVGKVVLSTSTVENQIRWWSLEEISRISYRGPLNNSGVGMSPTAPYALTLCGGDSTPTCKLLEMGTCFKRGLGDDCGLIEVVASELDSSDTEIDDYFLNITGFVALAKSSPNLFYLSVEANGTEIQRGGIGQICTRDHI